MNWHKTATLASPTVAKLRAFGDAVHFYDGRNSAVRENNFLDPIITGLKGQVHICDSNN